MQKSFIICAISIYVFLLASTVIHAQDSLSISPTPVSSQPSSPKYDINPQTLRNPEEFILDQNIKKATKKFLDTLESYKTASTKEAVFPTLENTASSRETLMKQALHTHPYIFLGNALTLSITTSIDQRLQGYIEKSLALPNVELGVVHGDDFENHTNSKFFYSLQDIPTHTQYAFFPVGEITSISGTTLTVNGVSLDDEISARVLSAPQGEGDNNDPVITNVEILTEASPDALGAQRVAVILVKPKGSTFTPYYTKQQVAELMINEIQPFFKEVSYDKMSIDTQKSRVYGWYEIENLNLHYNYAYELTQQVIALTDPDIDFREFDRMSSTQFFEQIFST